LGGALLQVPGSSATRVQAAESYHWLEKTVDDLGPRESLTWRNITSSYEKKKNTGFGNKVYLGEEGLKEDLLEPGQILRL